MNSDSGDIRSVTGDIHVYYKDVYCDIRSQDSVPTQYLEGFRVGRTCVVLCLITVANTKGKT